MFKLKTYNISLLNSMGLSKRNLGKLNTFIKKNNLISNNNSIKKPQESFKATNIEDPSKIFYSIIDNSENINETLEANQLLKKSEESFHNINARNSNSCKYLSIEDELYDEFNYLLDE
tara:strand:+ start:220 stop:573 length:354 start_codon:yes stop_codon:yes gene_type:complete